jgi:hypothetical protein
MSYYHHGDPYEDDDIDYGNHGNGDDEYEYESYSDHAEFDQDHPEPDHYTEYGDELNRAEPVYDNPDPTPSEYDHYQGYNNRTGGDRQKGYEGAANRGRHKPEGTEYETTEEVYTNQGEYESAMLEYEHTGSDYGVDEPQQPGYNNNETHKLECVSVRSVDPVIIVTKNPATVANTMCTSTSNCWGKSLLFAAVAEG